MATWLYLYFPDLYLHSLQLDPLFPFALLEERGNQFHVLQSNKTAHDAGIEADMPLATAMCLCPSLTTRLSDQHKSQHLLQQKALWAYQYSAQVSLDPPQGLWLEAASMKKLFGGMDTLCQQIKQQAIQQQWPLQLAVAHTPAAARVLAQANITGTEQSIATLPESTRNALLPLTIDQLALPESQQLELQRLGIHNYQQLEAIPAAELATRFNPELLNTLLQINGRKPHLLTFFQPPMVFRDEVLFIHEVEHINGLLFPIQRQLSTLSAFLFKRQLAVNQLNIQLKYRQPPDQPVADTVWTIRFARAECRQQELTQLLRYQLEKRSLSAPVRELILTADFFIEQQQLQQDYWPETAANLQGQELLNRLQARLEPQQLFRISSNADARPEHAWQAMDPMQQNYPQNTARNSNKRCKTADRPLWLLPKPIPCEQPQYILSGPERISSGWWHNGIKTQRDYYRAEQNQQQLWLFRDATRQWFIQGYFS